MNHPEMLQIIINVMGVLSHRAVASLIKDIYTGHDWLLVKEEMLPLCIEELL